MGHLENAADEAKGRAKEAIGAVTGADDLKEEGLAQQEKAQKEREAERKRQEAERAEAEARSAEVEQRRQQRQQ